MLKFSLIINLVAVIAIGNIYLNLNDKIEQNVEQSIAQELGNKQTQLISLEHSNQELAETLKHTLAQKSELSSNLSAIHHSLKQYKNLISFDSGDISFTKGSHPDFISDGSCERKRGAFSQRIEFDTQYTTPPKVALSLSSFDIWKGTDLRVRTELKNVDSKGFVFDTYTWCDTSLSKLTVSWVAIGI